MSRELDALLAGLLDAELTAEDRAEAEAVAELGLSLPPVPVPADLRDRLLGSLDAGPYEHQLGHIAQMLGLTREAARPLVEGIGDATNWDAGPLPGVSLYHLEPHIPLTNVIAGFTRITAGTTFPPHRHLGDEYTLVLAGTAVDSSGQRWQPGDLIHRPPESTHHYTVGPDADLVFLVVIFEGLAIGDLVLHPGDPDA